MVHNNPGESLIKSNFNDPKYLKEIGYNGIVINDFAFAHAAITFDSFDKRIFPKGSQERQWVLDAAQKVKSNIITAHQAGLKVYYFTDIIVLPKKLVELYHDEICDAQGRISFERPKTIEIHREMFRELFDSFPDLDGLVIRTGETYLNNVPYHTGNNPITNGPESHVKLLNLLLQEVCIKRHKKIIYRTWSFGGMHDDPAYYLKVTDRIEPDTNLIFSIKHTKGDYQRTFNFNPTLGVGNHRQIVEVECQREYEGKGAYPNYIAKGVIDGFEEYDTLYPQDRFKSLSDIKYCKQFAGVWTWARGGGWVGPYISNEFWCRLNAWVISHWSLYPDKTENDVFNEWMEANNLQKNSRKSFRDLCLLSTKAILREHESAVIPFKNEWVWWTRDEFLGGIEENSPLNSMFNTLYDKNLLLKAVHEKYEAVQLWKQISGLSNKIYLQNKDDQRYIRVSSTYGLLLSEIIAEGWNILALGITGDRAGAYDSLRIKTSIAKYDNYWVQYKRLKESEPSCASLYKPFSFVYTPPNYHSVVGMGLSIDRYRTLTTKQH